MTSGYRSWLVQHIPLGSVVSTNLDNVVAVRVVRTGKVKSNTAEIVFSQHDNGYLLNGEIKFSAGDTIKIWATRGEVDTTNTSHLIGVYSVTDNSVKTESGFLTVLCIDKTYNMLSKVWAGDETGTPPQIINKVVQTINEDGYTTTPVTTSIQSTNSSGAAFTSTQYFSVYKSGVDVVDELSQPQYTLDNMPYIYWFDENGTFYWEYPDDTVEATELNYGDEPVLDMAFEQAESDVISMIIYNAGLDKNDNAIVGFYLDPNAGTIKNKIKYQPMTDISKRIRRDLENAGTYTGMSNSDFIALCETSALAKARAIIQNIGDGLWQSKIKIAGAKYSFGALHTVSSTRHGLPPTELRVQRVQHDMDKKGWMTTLTLQEDPEPIEV